MWQFPDAPYVYKANLETFEWDTPTKDRVYYIFNKRLPTIRGWGTVHCEHRQIRLMLPDGKRITLHETEDMSLDWFPSDKLLAQVMLVAG